MTIVSKVDNLKIINLNSQQCIIQNVYLNEYMCEFTYLEPTTHIIAKNSKFINRIDTFSKKHAEAVETTDPDIGNGELRIKVPEITEIKSAILRREELKINITYFVENPKGGLYFAISPKRHSPHLYSYGRSNNSRLWFPCVDSYSESCTWSIAITCNDKFTSISSGDLSEVKHDYYRRKKRYFYTLKIPTSASNIGLAVGIFTPAIHSYMHDVISFSFPQFKNLMASTCAFTHRIFEYYEALINSRYPYPLYKQIFVHNLETKYIAYASMSIFSINILHSFRVIEQEYISRRIISQAISEQYFGCYISMHSCTDAWIVRGIASFLTAEYCKNAFGTNEYRYQVKRLMKKVINYEDKFRPIVLDPSSKSYFESEYFRINNFFTFSPLYDKMHRYKSFLIMRMLENYIGRELLIQVFNKMLSLAQHATTQHYTSSNWHHLYASTKSFIWAISNLTGKNITEFVKQWVYKGGHVKINASFIFNRKRNTVELEIKQSHLNHMGVRRYLGPLTIWLQELDGTFKHTLQIEDSISKHDLICHSKSRRNKKKKIPLFTGEEIDMDLSSMDHDSPVLWLRVDPEMLLLREIFLEQPDYQWTYQLRYERDIIAQLEALELWDTYSVNLLIKTVLLEILNNEQIFFRVRCEAAICLQKASNKLGPACNGGQLMINMFRRIFSLTKPNIIRMNNAENFELYFLEKALITAISGIRNEHGICPKEIIHFLLDIVKYNDNRRNRFSDGYFRGNLVEALANTVTPSAAGSTFSPAEISTIFFSDFKLILTEITRFFNMDKMTCSYKNVVTISCLKALNYLQIMNHLPSNPGLFRAHVKSCCFVDVRKTAIQILVDMVRREQRKEELDLLIDIIENDPSPVIKHYTIKQLVLNPPFKYTLEERSQLDNIPFLEKLTNMINGHFPTQHSIRSALVDLFYVLYDRVRPKCLPKSEVKIDYFN